MRKRPWIKPLTLEMIESRNEARRNGDRVLEKELNKQIRKRAQKDRAIWLEGHIQAGSWDEIKQYKKARKPKITARRLQNSQGEVVESHQRADTFAQHLEHVQWAERPMHPREERLALGPPIPSETGTITALEVQEAIQKLRTKRAAVQVPAEYLRALEAESTIDEDHW